MILIIDDDITIRSSLTFMLKRAGYEVKAVSNPKEAIAEVKGSSAPSALSARSAPSARSVPSVALPTQQTGPADLQLILMDMNFSLSTSGDEGLTLLKQVKLFRPDVPVILMTAWGSIDLAVKGMRAGAFDFVTKPWSNAALMMRIETALKLGAQAPHTAPDGASIVGKSNVAPSPWGRAGGEVIIGSSPLLLSCLSLVSRVAKTNASVLITGESGTGKELIAQAIHEQSLRSEKPFVKVNLGGMSQTLFESEMFGHKRGAFTDAVTDRVGRFEMADKGTIFLDEIGDLDMASQVKLLRVLQDQTFEPLGDSRTRKVDVRVVSATNADLPRLIDEHRFREDLYYRINLIHIHVPSLAERREDIPLLAKHFAKKIRPVEFAPDALDFLMSQHYSGNIRELKNVVERAILISSSDTITADDFRGAPLSSPQRGEASSLLADSERESIQRTLQMFDGNISRAAEHLGITRQALYRRIEKYGL